MIILGVGFAALNTGNNLLYLVESLLLAFLTLSGILSESALRGIEVRRNLPREIFSDTDNPLLIEIKNSQSRVPSFSIVVEDRAAPLRRTGRELDWRLEKDRDLPVLGRVFALRIGPGEVVSRSYLLHPQRRGPLHFHSVCVSTRFPFGLFSKSRTIRASETALVYPEITTASGMPIAACDDDEGEGSAPATRQGNEVNGLREFETGDSLRRVHWKSSLRRSRLQVKVQEEERNAEIEVRLRTAGARSREAFEERVRWAASEVVAHLSAGLQVGLVTDDDRIRPDSGLRQRARLLSFLAVVEVADRSRSDGSTPAAEQRRTGVNAQ